MDGDVRLDQTNFLQFYARKLMFFEIVSPLPLVYYLLIGVTKFEASKSSLDVDQMDFQLRFGNQFGFQKKPDIFPSCIWKPVRISSLDLESSLDSYGNQMDSSLCVETSLDFHGNQKPVWITSLDL